jgi:hypothetical protein
MTTGPMSPAAATSYLTRPEGRVAAYDVDGAGPLVVLVPGMGDPRSIHRFLIPAEALGDLTAPALIIVGEADPTSATSGPRPPRSPKRCTDRSS